MTETDPPAGTWCNNGTVLLTGAQLAADPSSPTLTKDSTQQLNLLEKWEKKHITDSAPPPTKVKEQLGQGLFLAVCF